MNRSDACHEVILVEARQGRLPGYVPLSDLEVVFRDDPNDGPVGKLVVWHAHRR